MPLNLVFSRCCEHNRQRLVRCNTSLQKPTDPKLILKGSIYPGWMCGQACALTANACEDFDFTEGVNEIF